MSKKIVCSLLAALILIGIIILPVHTTEEDLYFYQEVQAVAEPELNCYASEMIDTLSLRISERQSANARYDAATVQEMSSRLYEVAMMFFENSVNRASRSNSDEITHIMSFLAMPTEYRNTFSIGITSEIYLTLVEYILLYTGIPYEMLNVMITGQIELTSCVNPRYDYVSKYNYT